MLGLILLLVVSAGLQLDAWELDDSFTDFLSSPFTSISHPYHSFAVKSLYEQYKNKFNRPSMTSNEENYRYASFHNNVLNLIEHHKQGNKPYTVGLNKYADWTSDELQTLRGLRRPQRPISSRNFNPYSPTWHLRNAIRNAKRTHINDVKIERVKSNKRHSTLNKRQSPTTSSFDYTARIVTGTNTPIVSIILLFVFKLMNLFYLS
jgi:hypothetical protein